MNPIVLENEIKQENIFSLAGGIKTAENLPERHNKVRFDGRLIATDLYFMGTAIFAELKLTLIRSLFKSYFLPRENVNVVLN